MISKVILLVENNIDEQELLLFACQQSQFPIDSVVVQDGAEALDYLLGRGSFRIGHSRPMPALVLLNLNLPKINGLEVLRRLRADEQTKEIPVIIITQSPEPKELAKDYFDGCNSYIHKTVNFNEFQAKISQVLSSCLG
ncbi:response regulator receiver protein [Gloeothece citriformis PCC 7424]|uniref:Response regulator receiver protein n=1 Tax=Gloeothece citriformis (strain PCC 7424) TaxID=65393 RepID=B7KFP2_GLOC7|nr:response regulator [Gloeothece citriformis]ACK73367.1 response regulator receiver protein [Gloeothece citriformis PCC 7424]